MNDEWVIHLGDPKITGIECRIFDRWGDLVFEKKESPVIWDGRFNNQEVMPGVYVFKVQLKYKSGKSEVISGDVTLVR